MIQQRLLEVVVYGFARGESAVGVGGWSWGWTSDSSFGAASSSCQEAVGVEETPAHYRGVRGGSRDHSLADSRTMCCVGRRPLHGGCRCTCDPKSSCEWSVVISRLSIYVVDV